MSPEILVGPERHRRWGSEEKARIVEETASARVADVARRHGVSRSLIYGWRRLLLRGSALRADIPDLVPVVVEGGAAPPGGGVIEVMLAGGVRIPVRGAVDGEALRTVLSTLGPA